MKRIALRWLGALLLSITLAAPAMASGKHLINGIDANYPPFAYVDETGKPAGFDVDSMNWIAINAYGYRNFKRFRNRILHMFSNKHISSATKQATA